MRTTVATIINVDMQIRPKATTAPSPVATVGQDAAATMQPPL
jgi:hypothetical protein